ncbi:MICOS complex subunit MIC60 [Erythrobacter sp. LQ02-29]|uniref:MICOS complex subunit MIC60 n=1 Tax=Erythrobacter sp. LQ02-29 TaxID=2920384 RepID=UPI001F4ED58B|nr:MICOS complex subunit MIC60 [Erythrobacter sp. LQ02-29]MCP9222652.1 MICOS complex subunit MIC60 [Erythrobacter sp. LQ02-29]
MNETSVQGPRGVSWRSLLGIVLLLLLIAAAVAIFMWWRPDIADIRRDEVAQAESEKVIAPSASTPSPTGVTQAAMAPPPKSAASVARQQGGIEQRLAAAEQRLNQLDIQAQAAAGNAARAEGLLIAFAVRRSIERGAQLGYLADQLRLRFGDALPNAVSTIVENSRDPVTLDQLSARLEQLGPTLEARDAGPSLSMLKRELNQLFIIRRESSPSPTPERRLERARLFLESGRYEAAIDEVGRMPGADKAERWMADTRRYAAVQRALDLVETAAILEPRRLRDGSGNPVSRSSVVTMQGQSQQ